MRVLVLEELHGHETLQQEKCAEQRNTEVASLDSFHVSLRYHLGPFVFSAHHAEHRLKNNFHLIWLIYKVYFD